MSTTSVPIPSRSFTAAEAIGAYVRVTVDSNGKVAIADNDDPAIGGTEHAVASGDPVTVRLFAPTIILTAAGAITRGTQVYPDDAGKILATGSTPLNLVALESASATGDQIECAVCQVGAQPAPGP